MVILSVINLTVSSAPFIFFLVSKKIKYSYYARIILVYAGVKRVRSISYPQNNTLCIQSVDSLYSFLVYKNIYIKKLDE